MSPEPLSSNHSAGIQNVMMTGNLSADNEERLWAKMGGLISASISPILDRLIVIEEKVTNLKLLAVSHHATAMALIGGTNGSKEALCEVPSNPQISNHLPGNPQNVAPPSTLPMPQIRTRGEASTSDKGIAV